MSSFWESIEEACSLAEARPIPEGMVERGYAFSNEADPSQGMVPVGCTPDGTWHYRSLFGSWHPRRRPVTHTYRLDEVRSCFDHNAHPVGAYPEACASSRINQPARLVSELQAMAEAQIRAEVYRKIERRIRQLEQVGDEPYLSEAERKRAAVGGIVAVDTPSLLKEAFYFPDFIPKSAVEEVLSAAKSWQRKEAGSIGCLKVALRQLKEAVEAGGIPRGSEAGTWSVTAGASDGHDIAGYCPECGQVSIRLEVYSSGMVQVKHSEAADRQWKPTPLRPEGDRLMYGDGYSGWAEWRPAEAPPVCRFCR